MYVFSYFSFGFEGRKWDLIMSVPNHYLSVYFTFNISHHQNKEKMKYTCLHLDDLEMTKEALYLKIFFKYVFVCACVHAYVSVLACVCKFACACVLFEVPWRQFQVQISLNANWKINWSKEVKPHLYLHHRQYKNSHTCFTITFGWIDFFFFFAKYVCSAKEQLLFWTCASFHFCWFIFLLRSTNLSKKVLFRSPSFL